MYIQTRRVHVLLYVWCARYGSVCSFVPLALLDPWNRKPVVDLTMPLGNHPWTPGGDKWTCISMGFNTGGRKLRAGKDQER